MHWGTSVCQGINLLYERRFKVAGTPLPIKCLWFVTIQEYQLWMILVHQVLLEVGLLGSRWKWLVAGGYGLWGTNTTWPSLEVSWFDGLVLSLLRPVEAFTFKPVHGGTYMSMYIYIHNIYNAPKEFATQIGNMFLRGKDTTKRSYLCPSVFCSNKLLDPPLKQVGDQRPRQRAAAFWPQPSWVLGWLLLVFLLSNTIFAYIIYHYIYYYVYTAATYWYLQVSRDFCMRFSDSQSVLYMNIDLWLSQFAFWLSLDLL